LRTAALLRFADQVIVIDCGPDFRQQMLRAKVEKVDAILLTHEHNDHIIGLDDVRPFNFKQDMDMPVFAQKSVQQELKTRFDYIFKEEGERYPGAPQVQLCGLTKDSVLEFGAVKIQAVGILHGQLPIVGFRIGNFAYLTDVKTIAEEELKKLQNLDVLVINALHHDVHHSHLNLEEALTMAARIQAKQTYFTHMSHRMGLHAEIDETVPKGINFAYDGLEIAVEI
jgi:phosphoribosyl 1,2-cyclic phosphate phosphodiesterase